MSVFLFMTRRETNEFVSKGKDLLVKGLLSLAPELSLGGFGEEFFGGAIKLGIFSV